MTEYVAFSGGIDSTALALMMPHAIPVFTDTAWEFPEVYAHIAKFEEATGRRVVRVSHPQYPGGLPEYIRRSRFFPNHGARYCTRIFKIDALNLWLQSEERLPTVINIALRADEPADQRVGNLTQMDGLTLRYPLREWGVDRAGCVRACLEAGLLPRYPAYMARGGCKGCFYKRKSEVQAMIALIPGVMDELQELEQDVQDERGRYFHMFANCNMSIADMRLQPPLFDVAATYRDALDDSDTGVACGLFCRR